MIAMALGCEPKLLIADEPTTALDVTIQAQILTLLDRLKEQLGMAILLITHDMGVIAGHADRVEVMYAGRLVETANTGTLFSHMHHPYTQALLGSIPRLNQDSSQRLLNIPGIPPDLANPPPGCRFAARCSQATEKCQADTEPPLASYGLDHFFACWHPVDGPARLPDAPAAEALAAREATAQETAAAEEELAAAGQETAAAGQETAAAGQEQAAAGQQEAAAVPGEAAARPASSRPGPGAPAVQGDGHGPAPVLTARPAGPGELPGQNRAVGHDGIAAGPPLLEVGDVVKEFPVTAGAILQRRVASVHAVSGVSFTINAGETYGLVGESGCGKTTIGRVIVALERPTTGSVRLRGTDISALSRGDLRRQRRDLQMMFQDPYSSLDPRMRVGAIVREPLAIQHQGSREQQQQRVFELLDEVGLPRNAVERYPHRVLRRRAPAHRAGPRAHAQSAGHRGRRAGERAGRVDQGAGTQPDEAVLQADHGLTYIVISHDLAVVKYMADRIGVMYLGKLVEEGSSEDIYHRAAHPYTAGLIATIPVPDPQAARTTTEAGIRGELPSPINPPSGCRFRTRCPFAQDVCAEAEPPLRSFGPGHRAACHFPLQTPRPDADGPADLSPAGAASRGIE